MRKYIILLFVALGLLGSYLFRDDISRAFSNSSEVKAEKVAQTLEIAISPTPEEIEPTNPVTISIPSLNVTADVEHVGKDSEDRMDVPKEVMNAAWYELGALPGEYGNSVIAGHYDTPTGEPSIFYEINTLLPGDEIVVTDENGMEFVFNVTDVITYDNDNFPIKTVFGSHEKKRLNLITCAGIFDKEKRDYSDRTVVFSELYEVRNVQKET